MKSEVLIMPLTRVIDLPHLPQRSPPPNSLLRKPISLSSSHGMLMQPNAGRQPPPIAAAQRRLLAVACTPLFGWGAPVGLWIGCPPSTPRTSHSSRLLDHLVRLEEE